MDASRRSQRPCQCIHVNAHCSKWQSRECAILQLQMTSRSCLGSPSMSQPTKPKLEAREKYLNKWFKADWGHISHAPVICKVPRTNVTKEKLLSLQTFMFSYHISYILWTVNVSRWHMGYEECHSGRFQINFDHLGFFNVQWYCIVHLAPCLHRNEAAATGSCFKCKRAEREWRWHRFSFEPHYKSITAWHDHCECNGGTDNRLPAIALVAEQNAVYSCKFRFCSSHSSFCIRNKLHQNSISCSKQKGCWEISALWSQQVQIFTVMAVIQKENHER